MMSFLPYASFEASAAVLDWRRLNKQRVEALQMLLALTGRSGAWRNHPATRMWLGHEASLASYALAMSAEWVHRGGKDTVALRVTAIVKEDGLSLVEGPKPPWFGDERLHSSHRSNLLRKKPDHYGLLGWAEQPNQLYYWPPEARNVLPLPRRASTMDEKTAEAAVPTSLSKIQAIIADERTNVNQAVGANNVARFNARLDMLERVAKTTFERYGKQVAYATRPKRVKKEKQAAAAPAAK
jgi:hypothetical protein